MTIENVCRVLSAEKVNIVDERRELSTGYAGDLLSFVMGKAPTGCVWFTVMTNVNVCAVAALAEIALVVICEGSEPMLGFTEKAKEQNINVIKTDLDIFNAIKRVLNEGNL